MAFKICKTHKCHVQPRWHLSRVLHIFQHFLLLIATIDALGGMPSVYYVSCGMKTCFFITGPPRSTPKKPLSLPYGGLGTGSAGDLPPYPSSAYLVGDVSGFFKTSNGVLKDLVIHSRDVASNPEEVFNYFHEVHQFFFIGCLFSFCSR